MRHHGGEVGKKGGGWRVLRRRRRVEGVKIRVKGGGRKVNFTLHHQPSTFIVRDLFFRFGGEP
jgi:hypothetical protein